MNPSNKLLSDITVFRTYAKYLPHAGRRESFQETVNRCMLMHLERFPKLSRDIIKAFKYVHDYKIFPSMRTLQFAGSGILKNNLRGFNCSFTAIDDPRCFGEVLYLLLSGTGVGFSVQKHHTNKLPIVQKPREEGVHYVHDSIEGWAQALDLLVDAYFYRRIRPVFDFSHVRSKGTILSTTGAPAPGPEPLKLMLQQVEDKLQTSIGRRMKPLEIHDIVCLISACVLSGGIRRSALISLFDRDDKEMITCKSGEWWTKNPQRSFANNSAVLPRKEVSKEEFYSIYEMCEKSGAGEPGFYWTNDEFGGGTNPCGEIHLLNAQLCNLSVVNQTGVTTEKELLSRVYSATLLGTLQAAYCDFPYVRPIWRETTEREALLGVSFTGIADSWGKIDASWLVSAAKLACEVNEKYAKKIGINPAARITTIKPDGTSSVVFGSSSGIHARHAKHYLRRIRISKNDSLATYLTNAIPELVEDDVAAQNTIVVTFPQESPEGALTRNDETAVGLFERIQFYHKNWIKPGHRSGVNTHNVSCTISMKPEDWKELKEKLWTHKNDYAAVSLLPFSDSTYKQMPFEECDKATYDKYVEKVKNIDLNEIREDRDNTKMEAQLACMSGGSCEI